MRFWWRSVSAIALTAILAACGGAAASTGGSEQTVSLKIMVGGLNKQIYLPNKLTEQLGYFKAENLDVTLIDEASGQSSEDEVVAGNVQAGSGSYNHTIELQAAGKNMETVCQFGIAPGEAEVEDASKASDVTSVSDLKGKNLGVTEIGSGTQTLTSALLGQKGISADQVKWVGVGAGDTFIAAMKQGRIDVGITTQPTVLRLQKTGDAQVLVDLSKPETTQAALGGDYPFISLWGRADWIAAHKDTTQHVVNAYVKTMKWIATHSPQEIADKLPADYQAGDPAAYVQALTDSMAMFTPDGRMPQGGPEFVLKTLASFNPDLQAKQIDLSKTWDPTFVENANKQ